MSKVFATITSLESLAGGNKELYVVALSTDKRGGEDREADIIGAHNERITRFAPEIIQRDAMNWMIVSISNIFERVRPGRPAIIMGDGIILYPELDPKGLLGMHVAIMESDSGHRELGKRLDETLGSDDVKSIIEELATAGVPHAALIGKLMRTVTDIFFKKNKDDILLTFNYSGRASNNYGLGVTVNPDSAAKDFPFENHLVKGNFQISLV